MSKPPVTAQKASRILVIDDDADVRTMICRIVSSVGHEAVELDKARDALPMVERGAVDLVLLDIKMPGVGGLDLLKVIRRRHLTIPVVVVSGFISQDMARELTEIGVQGIVAKPFKKERLIETLGRVLGAGPA